MPMPPRAVRILASSSPRMRLRLPPSALLLSGVASASAAWAPVAFGTGLRAIVRGVGAATTALSGSIMPPLTSAFDEHLPLARDAMAFIDGAPDPFHAVRSAVDALEDAGFVEWDDGGNGGRDGGASSSTRLEPGGRYYFTRNRSTLVAFAVGSNYEPGAGFKIIGSHTDSPNLKVKPHSKRTTARDGGASGSIQLAVECYGGGLWHTWFDRDLGVSGRVFVRDGEAGRIRQELVKIDRAVLRIPNLAIHLQTAKEREAFAINKEDHLAPILATAVKDSLGGKGDGDGDGDAWRKNQEPLLVQLIASELGVDEGDIVDFELNLFDVQPATLGGMRSEFVHTARLDNLASCFLSLRGLIEHVEEGGGAEEDGDVSMIAMFDHEEGE